MDGGVNEGVNRGVHRECTTKTSETTRQRRRLLLDYYDMAYLNSTRYAALGSTFPSAEANTNPAHARAPCDIASQRAMACWIESGLPDPACRVSGVTGGVEGCVNGV